MEIKEKESIKKEKIYELTKNELKQIIKSSYNISRKYLSGYIGFCYCNYIYKMNITGMSEFLLELAKFICSEKDYINNKSNISYRQYVASNFYCPWNLNNLNKLINK